MPKRKTTEAPVTVKMTEAHTYRTGPSTRRTLPAGWIGAVPAEVAAEIEKAGNGGAVKTKPADKARPAKSTAAKAAATPKAGETPATADGDGTEPGSERAEAADGDAAGS